MTQEKFDSVKAALKFGEFGPDFAANLDGLVRSFDGTARDDLDPRQLKNLSVVAEGLDHIGAWEQARTLTREVGRDLWDALRTGHRGATPDVTLEMVRFSMAYCRAHFYRRQQYESAKDITLKCLGIAKSLRGGTHYRTLGQISLQLGRTLRESGDHVGAEAAFQDAADYFNSRLLLVTDAPESLATKHPRSDEWLDRERRFARYKIAQCLAGLGWVCYTTGALRKALSYVVPAHTLLLGTPDLIGRAYLDVLRGAIYRSQAGSNHDGLRKARDIVERAAEVLRVPMANGRTHEPRRGRCVYELAHIYSLLGENDAARDCFDELNDLTRAHGDDERSRCDTLILESRVKNRAGDAIVAEAIADKALLIARKRGFSAPQIGALISRGEARLHAGKSDGARQDFMVAKKLNKTSSGDDRGIGNPQIAAVCELQIARCEVASGDRKKATDAMIRGLDYAKGVEQTHVHELAAQVRREVDGDGRNYVILESDQDLNYRKKKLDLRRFLYTQAETKSAGQKAVMAQNLGITRQALHTWEREMKGNKSAGR